MKRREAFTAIVLFVLSAAFAACSSTTVAVSTSVNLPIETSFGAWRLVEEADQEPIFETVDQTVKIQFHCVTDKDMVTFSMLDGSNLSEGIFPIGFRYNDGKGNLKLDQFSAKLDPGGLSYTISASSYPYDAAIDLPEIYIKLDVSGVEKGEYSLIDHTGFEDGFAAYLQSCASVRTK